MSKKLRIFIFFLLLLAIVSAKESQLKIKFMFGLSYAEDFINNHSLGFWGFVDPNIDKKYFNGYFFGLSLGTKMTKNIDLFADASIFRTSLLLGRKNSYFRGAAIREADPYYSSNISPLLPNDIYYISKAVMGRLGFKIFPFQYNNIETYLGFALGLVPYEIAFANRDGTQAYSEILTDITTTYAIIFGTDFKLIGQMKLGMFFEIGGAATESKEMHNWIWKDWIYHAQFPVVPLYRFGLSLEF